MAFISVYFGLGSNVGDRLRNIGTAVRMLDEALGSPHTALSRIMETEAWGFEGADFLNACIRYRIHRKGTPEEHGHELLRICKGIDAALGRQEAVVFDGEGRRVTKTGPWTSTSFSMERSGLSRMTWWSRIR